jgi:MFS family permease
MGGGGIVSVGVIVLTDLVDLRHRGLLQGYSNILFGLGGALGGPLGGWISDRLGWRTAFGAQVPFLVVAAFLVYFFVRFPSKAPLSRESWRSKLAKIDYLGSITLAGAVGSLLLSISIKTSAKPSSGGEYTWSHPLIWGLLIASVVLTSLFLLVETRCAVQPILPLSLMRRRTPAAVALSLLCVVTNQFSILYDIPLFFSAVRLDSASVAGTHLLPYTIFIGAGSVTIGWIMRKTGRYWWAGVGSALVIVSSSTMLIFWSKEVPGWLTWLAPIPAGFGYAGVLTSTLVGLMTNVERARKGEV